ncbi:MAG: protein phosphatase 2C domain-containing protein [Burkholderiaceae bacterium]|nr:protein phosphatase 2C domain-containing protein [Burkholderiaceae bacterium]
MKNGYRLSAATGLHRGDRDHQQDQVTLLTHRRVSGCVLGVVADGMGGRTGGRKASDQVLMTARQLFDRFVPENEDAAVLLQQIGQEAHLVIRLTALSAEQEPHSTIAAFLIGPGGGCHWIHCGDSRIYHFHGSTLVHRTVDHSYVQTLVQNGEISPEEAETHPKSNVLTSCLGMEHDPTLDLHFIPQLQPGDFILACSDGIWHYFTTEELASVLNALPPREASVFLIEKARLRAQGSGDNMSLAIVKVDALEEEEEPEPPHITSW